MFNSSKLIDRLFKKVDNVVWDITTGKIAVKNKSGTLSSLITSAEESEKEKEKEGSENLLDFEIEENLFSDFGTPIPAFATNQPVDTVKLGDLLITNSGTMGWVTKISKTGKTISLVKPDGHNTTFNPPKTNTIGINSSGVMIVRSLFDTVGQDNADSFKNSLLPLIAMSDSEDDISGIMPILLMQQTGAMSGDNNLVQTMMMMKMMSGDGDSGFNMDMKGMMTLMLMGGGNAGGNNMLQTMMMMKMMGGDKNNNKNYFDRSN